MLQHFLSMCVQLLKQNVALTIVKFPLNNSFNITSYILDNYFNIYIVYSSYIALVDVVDSLTCFEHAEIYFAAVILILCES